MKGHDRRRSLPTADKDVQAVAAESMEEVSVMKIRIRFSKKGPVKFIGHLDILRYFLQAK